MRVFADRSHTAITQNLLRLKTKKEIALIRQRFYVIVPPEYSNQGIIPPYLYLDDMMRSLDKPYYVGLLSAAALHGAAHQQSINSEPINPILKRMREVLDFLGTKRTVKQHIPNAIAEGRDLPY